MPKTYSVTLKGTIGEKNENSYFRTKNFCEYYSKNTSEEIEEVFLKIQPNQSSNSKYFERFRNIFIQLQIERIIVIQESP
jgi:hypothetical protein